MNVYDTNSDLYDIEDKVPTRPKLNKLTMIINNEELNGYKLTYNKNHYFVFRANSHYHVNGKQWGNPWSVYSVLDNKIVVSGRRTREQAIEGILGL